jgi:DHA3 family macrolide efflux protein-like MFS transporter
MPIDNWKRNTVFFLTGQTITLFGTMLVQYAIIWHVALRTGSGSAVTVLTIAAMLPMFFISPFGGVWADLYNKKHVINIADGVIAAFSLLVSVLLYMGIDAAVILIACAFVRSLGQGVQSPAVSAFIPEIVPEEELTRINGIQNTIQSSTGLFAPMLAGALMAFAPLEAIFLIDVVTALIGISILYFCVKAGHRRAPNPDEPTGLNYFREIKEGLSYVRRFPFILYMMTFSILFDISISPAAFLTPLQVTREFEPLTLMGYHLNIESMLAAIEMTFCVGMIIGGLLIGRWGGFRNRIHTMVVACLINGIAVIGLGLTTDFLVYNLMMVVIGLIIPYYNTPALVMLQTKVEPVYMGRVMSLFSMASSLIMPAGMLIFGPLADLVTIDSLLIVTGGLILLMCIPMYLNKTLRKAGKP